MTITESHINQPLQAYADLHYGGKVTKFGGNSDKNQPSELGLFGGDGLGFGDVIDAVNPLQHIPIISNIYRAVTGDEISTASRLTGGGLFGGVLGLAGATANAVLENQTGNDAGGHALSLLDNKADTAKDDKGFNHILSHKLVANLNIEPFIQPNQQTPITQPKPTEPTASIKQSLEIYRNASIQLNENKQIQLQEKLTKVAINMKK